MPILCVVLLFVRGIVLIASVQAYRVGDRYR
jgi:hypothetical protein